MDERGIGASFRMVAILRSLRAGTSGYIPAMGHPRGAVQWIGREATHIGMGAAGAIVVIAAFVVTPFALVASIVARRIRGA